MRARDTARLTQAPYDVAIIGGGIHGLACAYEMASRGLRVALIEARDFGGGTSFNQQKTAHGGLRALQTLSIGRARAGIRERRGLARIAPWLLRPLPFITGTYRSVRRGRLALRAAFALDEWLGRKRNEGVEPELHLPRARLLSRTATMKLFPGVREERLTGGAQWYDYQMVENDRLTFAFAAAADRAGADLTTYLEAREVLREGGRIAGLRAVDTITGETIDTRARLVVNAAGGRGGDVMRLFGVSRPFPVLKAMNLLTARPASDIALAASGPDGRMLTLVPWRGRALVGTGQARVDGPDGTSFSEQDVEAFIASANHAFPALQLTRQEITLVHRGLVPAVTRRDGSLDLLMAAEVLDHAGDGADGAISVIGAKYTTARGAAERVAQLAARKLGTSLRPSRTASTVLPFAGIADHEALAIETGRKHGIELDAGLIRHLTGRYAEGAAAIVTLMANQPGLERPLAPPMPTIAAEVVYVIREEAALTLSDIVVRRTTAGAAGHPGEATVRAAAEIAAAELGWDDVRVTREMADVERVYRLR